uniref:Uncharacterized protein n=1 Tax=Rhizophora mucronata TaxID=61149 RepID=A0A2P2M341_RHIMU
MPKTSFMANGIIPGEI